MDGLSIGWAETAGMGAAVDGMTQLMPMVDA